jgi:hypothetical protein
VPFRFALNWVRSTSPAFLLLLLVGGCSSRTATPRDPGTPTPAAGPAPGAGTTGTPQVTPASRGTGGLPARADVPLRPDQAPVIHIHDIIAADSLVGRRVRVSGRCTSAGTGPRAGSWILEEQGETIEVRGLVPYFCSSETAQQLTIFAQIEPIAPGSHERLLLRLPD